MDTVDLIERFEFGFLDKFLDGQISSVLLSFSDPYAEYCFLFKEFQTLFQVSGQVAFSTWSYGDVFESITAWSNRKGVNDDVVIDENSGSIDVVIPGGVVLAVGQGEDSELTVWVSFLEGDKLVGSENNGVVEFGWAAGVGAGDESVEVENSFGKVALDLNLVIEEDQWDDMLEIIGDGPVGKSLKETLDCSDSHQIRFIEELTAHGSWNIKQYNNCLFRLPCNDWFEIVLVDFDLSVFSSHCTAH